MHPLVVLLVLELQAEQTLETLSFSGAAALRCGSAQLPGLGNQPGGGTVHQVVGVPLHHGHEGLDAPEQLFLLRSGGDAGDTAALCEHPLQVLRAVERLEGPAQALDIELDPLEEGSDQLHEVRSNPGQRELGVVGHFVQGHPEARLAHVQPVVGSERLDVGDHVEEAGTRGGWEPDVELA